MLSRFKSKDANPEEMATEVAQHREAERHHRVASQVRKVHLASCNLVYPQDFSTFEH